MIVAESKLLREVSKENVTSMISIAPLSVIVTA